jgi:hypothetical protein
MTQADRVDVPMEPQPRELAVGDRLPPCGSILRGVTAEAAPHDGRVSERFGPELKPHRSVTGQPLE